MRGIVFNLFESFVRERLGVAPWYEVLREATGSMETVYIGPGNYPDEEFLRLLAATRARFNLTSEEVLVRFGRDSLPRLATRYPTLLAGHASAKSALLSIDRFLDDVRQFYPEPEATRIHSQDLDPDRIALTYSSPRKLCPYLTGLFQGVADWYGQHMRMRHTQCVLRGDACCRFEIELSPLEKEPARHG